VRLKKKVNSSKLIRKLKISNTVKSFISPRTVVDRRKNKSFASNIKLTIRFRR
jgi:hypothetical protein